MEVFGTQLLAGLGDLVQWESVVMHLIALIILTVGLYFLLFKPVKRMVKERQDKIRKIEKENTLFWGFIKRSFSAVALS